MALERARKGFPAVLAGACAIVLCAVSACHRTPPEQIIRDTIAQMQAAGEKQEIDGVMAPVAEDFAGRGDDEINLDRKTLVQFLTVLRMQHGGALHATLGPITVALQGTDRATADFTMLVTGGHGVIPHDGQLEDIRTGWRLDGGHWKLISAEWKAAGAGK
jgi:hypothetical protein